MASGSEPERRLTRADIVDALVVERYGQPVPEHSGNGAGPSACWELHQLVTSVTPLEPVEDHTEEAGVA